VITISVLRRYWHRNADELLREMAAVRDIKIVQVAAGGLVKSGSECGSMRM
jgi:diphthamide synthase (EF-2-diphthine--ammonia ligase)